MRLDGLDFVGRRGVPHSDGVVLTRGGEPIAVRAERHAEDSVGVPLESKDYLSSFRRPTFTVRSSLAEASRLPSELNTTLMTAAGMPSEALELMPSFGVPQLHRLVIAGGGESCAVRAERHAADEVGVL